MVHQPARPNPLTDSPVTDAEQAMATCKCPVCGAEPGKCCFEDNYRPVIHGERAYLIERMSAVDRLARVMERSCG